MEEGLKRRVIDIVRNLQLTLFRSYQQLEVANAKAEEAQMPSPADAPPSSHTMVSPAISTPGTSAGAAQSEPATDEPLDSPYIRGFAHSLDPHLPDPLHLLDPAAYSLFGDDFDFGQFMGGGVDAASSTGDFSESGYSIIASRDAVDMAQDTSYFMKGL